MPAFAAALIVALSNAMGHLVGRVMLALGLQIVYMGAWDVFADIALGEAEHILKHEIGGVVYLIVKRAGVLDALIVIGAFWSIRVMMNMMKPTLSGGPKA